MLSIYIDFKSPASYLAMAPTLSLIQRTEIKAKWHPYVTTERAPPESMDNESVGESHRRVRAESRRAIQTKYAANQGINLNFPAVLGCTDLALGALATLKGDPVPYIRAAFTAYWTHHADLNDAATVANLLAQSGINEDELIAALADAQEDADAKKIVEAPAYIIAEQLFIGREHLPWIEDIIAGTASDTREAK